MLLCASSDMFGWFRSQSLLYNSFNIISFQAGIRVSQCFILCDVVAIRDVGIQERIQLLEKLCSDLRENIVLAEDKIQKLNLERETMLSKQREFITHQNELKENIQDRDDTID